MPSHRSSSVCWSRFTSWYSSTVNARITLAEALARVVVLLEQRDVRSRRSSKSIRPAAALRRSYSRYTPVMRSTGIGGLCGRRAPRRSGPARGAGSSPTRSRSRDRRPAGTGTASAETRDVDQHDRLRREDPGRAPAVRMQLRRAPPRGTSARLHPVTPSATSRARISPAALSVNVTARISSARNAPVATWFAIRRVIVVVLPDPAPARMQTVPRTASTARRCSGFRSAKMGSLVTPPRLVGRPVGVAACAGLREVVTDPAQMASQSLGCRRC